MMEHLRLMEHPIYHTHIKRISATYRFIGDKVAGGDFGGGSLLNELDLYNNQAC